MARFYQKSNGECIERNDNVQIDQDDIVTWYRVQGPSTKYSELSRNVWTNAIGSENSLIIVDKNRKSMYIFA